MTQFIKIANTDDVPPGGRFFYEFEEETVVLFNIGGTYFCVADLCSHDDGPLEDGKVTGFAVECPRHGAQFDVRDGRALCMPATEPIPTYQVKVEDGAIFVESPDDF